MSYSQQPLFFKINMLSYQIWVVSVKKIDQKQVLFLMPIWQQLNTP
jgi:hypothetical protein